MSSWRLDDILSADVWTERTRAHLLRAERHTVPARSRKDRGIAHPVEDFLFQYYAHPISLLETWVPGIGTGLRCDEAADPPRRGRYDSLENGVLFSDPGLLSEKEAFRLGWIRDLLESTRTRPGNFSCHGLHEWAMVYRGTEIRHEKTTPLRLPQKEIDRVVESRPICCSHFDAFRFFDTAAKPLNRLQPTLEKRPEMEQPGCVHANMDLYKWAAKSMPWTGSDLLLDCFELALELRSLDMRASPYDLSAWGCEPIRIETPEGRKLYEDEQRRMAGKAAPLRERLIVALRRTLAAIPGERAQTPCHLSF